ncbi:MAG TPA: non-homologous end-joining DNA ligase [Casimicrobiaceae bacterium]|nr:non-homologous end-joining DNA ligase [Casimicrobiaceae bacterium]
MARSELQEYAAKREFAATPEPKPAVGAPTTGPLLFVVQQHSARRMHYDFRLECDGVLKSWAVPKAPALDPEEKRLAVQTEDHPYDYASFEGVIPPGQYGAGEVIVWDCGVYSPDEDHATWFHDRRRAESVVREGLAKGKLSILLRGEKIKGSFALVRTKEAKTWLLIKHRDRFASKADVTERDRSVLSGATVEEMKAVPAHPMPATRLVPAGKVQPMPDRLAPMLAETTNHPPFRRSGWMWEPKLDGYRALAFIRADGVKLRSRRGLDLTGPFPGIVAELARQDGGGMILDGEIVAFDASGRPSFNALQNRVQLKSAREIAEAEQSVPVAYFCFDLLHFGGIDLMRLPYADRRRYLSQCLLPSSLVQLVYASEDGEALREAAPAAGFEGVVAKRKDSRYEPGKRSGAWLKVKPTTTADFVVGGYTRGKGSREPLGALLVGYWDKEKLHYASHVGSGFDEASLADAKARLEPLRRSTRPFVERPELNAPTTWVEPKLVAEVEFHSWTGDGALRAPVFKRLRDDIDPKSVQRPDVGDVGADSSAHLVGMNSDLRAARARRGNAGADSSAPASRRAHPAGLIADVVAQLETAKASSAVIAVGPHRLKVTHLDRVYWPADPALNEPALTKRDLLTYLALVSPYILAHLADRPLTMIRMPDGIGGPRFFQKHWEQEKPPFAETVNVWSDSKDESHEYLLCNNLPTLLWLAQSGTLEFHIWHSRAKLSRDARSKSTDYDSSLEALEASVLNYPDWVVFDIDPYIYSGNEKPRAEPELNTVAFEKGKEVAFWLKDLLNGMALEPVVKTSGKTGLHVFVPIRRTIDFDAARHVSELVGRHLLHLHPKDITLEWSVPKRTGKIFMDYNMNVRGKTLNVAYSPRGALGAPVSMPLTWEELAGAHPLDFRIMNVPQRLAESGDRWRDVLTRKQSLERALERTRAEPNRR